VSAAVKLRPVDVECRYCGAPAGTRCARRDGTSHRSRAKRAAQASTIDALPALCECRNHMGAAKKLHKTREAAVMWAIRDAPRALSGMRFEPYACPTRDGWHIRTARETAK
jgi:hypothetical protein